MAASMAASVGRYVAGFRGRKPGRYSVSKCLAYLRRAGGLVPAAKRLARLDGFSASGRHWLKALGQLLAEKP